MSRALVIVNGPASRAEAQNLLARVPVGTRVEFKASKRSTPQNAMMWALLTQISKRPWVDGKRYTAEDLKDYFIHALKRERWMPDEDGGFVPIGRRSSDLSKEEMGDLLELIMAFCVRHDIDFERPSSQAT
jgi:hypothetical protein